MGVVSLAAVVLTLLSDFFLMLSSSWITGCCRFGFRLLRPGRLPGGGHIRLLGLRDRTRRGIWIWFGLERW